MIIWHDKYPGATGEDKKQFKQDNKVVIKTEVNLIADDPSVSL